MSTATSGRRWLSRSEAETEEVGAELVHCFGKDQVLLLTGNLGSGKTVLVRGLATALGVDRREVQSPTYSLIHEHQGAFGRLVHIDLYRLEPPEVAGLGLEELIEGPGIKAIEWADRLPAPPPDAVQVHIRRLTGGGREITTAPPPERRSA
ncbi:MAG: tRNA (adenosine(37)-N6)-threonylcarbamoyltransferase complex ATPase subunit type 1 TsaE [Thermoanaerobaculia bacterium]